MEDISSIQIFVPKKFRDNLKKSAKERGYNTVAAMCRVLLVQLEKEGYFKNPRSEMKVYQLKSK